MLFYSILSLLSLCDKLEVYCMPRPQSFRVPGEFERAKSGRVELIS